MQLRNSKSKDAEIDYIISPVRDENGEFFDSRRFMDCEGTSRLPHNADANGAYNIARKTLYAIDVIKATDDRDLDRDGGRGIDMNTGYVIDFGDIYIADKSHGGVIEDIERDGIDMGDIK